MNTDLPQPLTPSECELRDFPFMPLDVVRLRDSDIAAVSTGDEFRCAVLLWCASWHQVPAASLPDDDMVLCQLAGFGRVVKAWKKVRAGALRGWVKCSDGRLYHPVVAEKANEAWLGREKYREEKEKDRIRKAEIRAQKKAEEEARKAAEDRKKDANIRGLSAGQNQEVHRTHTENPPESPLIGTVDSGQGQWTGTVDSGELTSKADTSSLASTAVGAGEGQDETTKPLRNAQIAKLLRAKGIDATSQHPLVCMTWAIDPAVTDEILDLAADKAREAKPNERISVNYLKPIVDQLLNPPAPKDKPQKPPQDAWWMTNAGIDRKGKELGMFARGTESYNDFKDRIFAEIRKREGGKAA